MKIIITWNDGKRDKIHVERSSEEQLKLFETLKKGFPNMIYFLEEDEKQVILNLQYARKIYIEE